MWSSRTCSIFAESGTTMTTTTNEETAIPLETARSLCAAIQAENRHRWYTAGGMMCRGCLRFSHGDAARMCYASRPDNRGCYQINGRFDHAARRA